MSHKLLVSLGFLALGAAVAHAQEGQTPRFKSVSPAILKKIEAALPDKAPAMPKASRKVLIYSRTNGFRHSSIPVGAAALTLLGEKTGAYTAVHTEDDSYFEPNKLKEFNAVIMLNTTGQVFRPADKNMPKDAKAREAVLEREGMLKQSLIDFVKRGGGLAGMHAATDTYHNWGEYNRMMGGAFIKHPWGSGEKVSVKNLAPDHPLNQVFNHKGFDVVDEIYQFRPDTALPTERRMLLALDGGKMDVSRGKREDNFYPISWVSTYGKGHTFYCSLGHNEHIYFNPAIMQHYLAGIQYALGDLSADATPTPVR
jgi:type 1 glutamine amidotransferase